MTATHPLADLSAHPFTVLVFFRGAWCPFCQSYLRELNQTFTDQVQGAGGAILAITSQGQEAVDGIQRDWALRYPMFSAPDNALARRFGAFVTPKAQTPLAGHPTEYPDGMAQPAVIVLNREGEVVWSWAINPNEMNIGGAADRPLPQELWSSLTAALAGQPVQPFTGARLSVDFLKQHYPAQHQTFLDWVASMSK